ARAGCVSRDRPRRAESSTARRCTRGGGSRGSVASVSSLCGHALVELARRMTMNMITMPSPLGVLRLYAEADELVGLYLPDQPAPAALERGSAVLSATAAQLGEYFDGTRR